MAEKFGTGIEFAKKADQEDALSGLRSEFILPDGTSGKKALYFAGNSLGLQPKATAKYVLEELEDWGKLAVEGHVRARHPWLPYHEFVTEPLARLVGALPSEVVAMNSLTVDLHLLMVSFYRPTPARHKILIEGAAFPSDQYAVASQLRFHGFDSKEALVEARPRPGEATLRTEDIVALIEREGSKLALILLGQVNYLTGQAFDVAAISKAARKHGIAVGLDLAHGVGNVVLSLHDWEIDFAAWCSYKYLNSGPGAIAGVFVHEKHLARRDLPRFEGWWGHCKETRFEMPPHFDPIPTAEAWQLSNPPILQLAALRASLELFDRATMPKLRAKSERLTGYLEALIAGQARSRLEQITPKDPAQRGAQLSYRVPGGSAKLVEELLARGVMADSREPDVIRFAPVPLYTSFEEVFQLAQLLENALEQVLGNGA